MLPLVIAVNDPRIQFSMRASKVLESVAIDAVVFHGVPEPFNGVVHPVIPSVHRYSDIMGFRTSVRR